MKKMKQLKTVWSAFFLMSILFCAVSCNNEDIIDDTPIEDEEEQVEDETPPALELNNQMKLGDDIIDFKSAFGMDFSGNAFFVCSPDENVTTFAEVGEEVVMIGIAPTAIGRKLDLIEDALLASISISLGTENIYHIIGNEALEGTLEIKVDDDNNFILELDALVIEGGKEVKIKAQGVY